MMLYISIDGDDVGNKIAAVYIENDERKLFDIINDLNSIVNQICSYLRSKGCEIIYCAADGIACKSVQIDIDAFVAFLKTVGQNQFTFSAGVGDDLQSSFFALKYAKATGKNKVVMREKGAKFRVVETLSLS